MELVRLYSSFVGDLEKFLHVSDELRGVHLSELCIIPEA
jgi:hypothetical protein